MAEIRSGERLTADFDKVSRKYSYLTLEGGGSDAPVIRGMLDFCAEYDGVRIEDAYLVEISKLAHFPKDIPVVRELRGRVPRHPDSHAYDDGMLCLATPPILYKKFEEEPTLIGFIERLVIPYLFSHTYWERYGKYPWGEARHGSEGVKDVYLDLLGVDDEYAMMKFLRILAMDNYKGHFWCNCGSGKHLRDCHGPMLIKLSGNSQKQFMRDYVGCLPDKKHAQNYPLLVSKKTITTALRLDLGDGDISILRGWREEMGLDRKRKKKRKKH